MATTAESLHTPPLAPTVPICKLSKSLSQKKKANNSAEISGYMHKFDEEKCQVLLNLHVLGHNCFGL